MIEDFNAENDIEMAVDVFSNEVMTLYKGKKHTPVLIVADMNLLDIRKFNLMFKHSRELPRTPKMRFIFVLRLLREFLLTLKMFKGQQERILL